MLAATQSGDWKVLDGGRARVGPRELDAGEWELRLRPKEGVVSAALSTNDAVAVLDVAVTPELRAEGMARDVVRFVQQARKDAGLHVSDRIALWVEADGDVHVAVHAHRAYLAAQTLAKVVTLASPPEGVHRGSGKVEGHDVAVGVVRAG